MRLLALLHRWTGGLVGLLLAVIGLSGTALLWEDSWILLDGSNEPAANNPQALGRAMAVALETGPGLSRVTFASEEIGLHQAIYADGGGAYIAQDGTVVERWTSIWERPELWLFDLHHHLLLGETGKTVTGLLGIALLGFCITGIVLWWPMRRTFRPRLWPARLTASAIIRHHRDLGLIASPLLILVAATGSLMVFPAAQKLVLSPLAGTDSSPRLPTALAGVGATTDWELVMTNASAVYSEASPRRLTLPTSQGSPIAIRYRQDFEWTPNGRSYVWVDPGTARVIASEDPAMGDAAAAIAEKLYPIHAAKVGGLAWRLLMTFTGISLVLLGALASVSFWGRQLARQRPIAARKRPDGHATAG
ncbi:PepSY-associated TM helix domain-containing protein [Erythrobacter sp.]|uniref:PepSY-associated TM helix domain-containing protein n=1 Tax=Erythrobacter sp. TaxID=1042 RepID=UPI00311E75B3